MKKSVLISTIRSDHGGEFENHVLKEFCDQNGIVHNFSSPRTPQQNGVLGEEKLWTMPFWSQNSKKT